MQTTPPMVIAKAPYAADVQPSTRKTAQVAIKVAIAMPEIGFDDVPINPVMRDDTVTNRNPNITMNTAAAIFAKREVCAPGTGLNVSMPMIINMTTATPPIATFMLKSLSVRFSEAVSAVLLEKSFMPARNAATIVGIVFSSVINPAAATAPAPIGRIYVPANSLGVMSAINFVPGYKGAVR